MSTRAALAIVAVLAVGAYLVFVRGAAGAGGITPEPGVSLAASPAYNPALGGYKFAQVAAAPPGMGGGAMIIGDAPVTTRAGAIGSGLGGVGGKL